MATPIPLARLDRIQPLTWVALTCGACFVTAIVVIGFSIVREHGFPLDDSWIALVIGRNTAEYGIPSFQPGVRSSGSTSTIWPWIVALDYVTFPRLSPVVYLFSFNSLCLLAIMALLFSLAQRDKFTPLEVTLLAALPPLTGNVAWLTSTGMEHLFYVVSVLAAAFLWTSDSRNRGGNLLALSAGLFCGIAIATRPEGVILPPLFFLLALHLRKTRREILVFFLPVALAILVVITENWITAHSFLPVTFNGRRWLYFNLGGEPAGRLQLTLYFLQQAMGHIRAFALGLDFNEHGNDAALLLITIAFLAGLWRLASRNYWRILFLLGLTAAHIATYAVSMPSIGHAMRYQPFALIFAFPLAALGTLELMERAADALNASSNARRLSTGTLVAAFILLALRSLLRWGEITDLGIQHINNTHVRMGNWLAANLPPRTAVAAFDFGAIAYFSHMRIVDIGGLTDRTFLPYLYSHRSSDYLRQHNVTWIVIPERYSRSSGNGKESCVYVTAALGLCDSPNMQKQEIVSFSTPRSVWEPGILATGHAAPRQALYNIHWR